LNSPLVTVITPTFQHELFIGECLNSVKAQTFPSWEQIVVDDASTDRTGEIVKTFAANDPRVRYISQAHLGIYRLAETYNHALSEARGEFIGILEGDDMWDARHLASLVPALQRDDAVLAYGRAMLHSPGDQRKHVIPNDRFIRRFGFDALFNRPVGSATAAMLDRRGLTYVFPCALLIRRSTLERIGGFRHVAGLGTIDYPTLLEVSLLGRFAFVDSVVARWRRHANAVSTRLHDNMYKRVRDYALGFVERPDVKRVVSPHARRAVLHSWRGLEARVAAYNGRVELLRGNWHESRAWFRAAMRTTDPLVLGAAISGVAASYLHVDLEAIVRATGRIDLHDTGLDFDSPTRTRSEPLS